MQRRIVSAIETVFNTAVGYGVSVVIGLFIYPVFGVEISIAKVGGLSAVFTAASLGRGYIIRRAFVWLQRRGYR